MSRPEKWTMVEALLAAGGDPALGSPSALEVARFFEHADMVELLEAKSPPSA